MKTPLISIIIPTYNREHLIRETLDSIINQTYSNWECILVDDGSSDSTLEIINEYHLKDPRFIFYKRPRGFVKGANSCRNFGFKKSKGKFINWFDSDDIMHCKFLASKLNSFQAKTDVVIAKTQFFKKNINTILSKEKRTNLSDNLLEDFVTLTISWYISDPMWRREFIEHKELFSEKLLKGQDRDFHIRMLLKSPKIKIVDEYLTYYRSHEATISNSISPEIARSMFNANFNRILEFKKIDISKSLKYFLLKQQLKNYPYMYKESGSTSKFFKVFKDLFSLDIKNIILFFKFCFAVVSFNILGKGSVLLKK